MKSFFYSPSEENIRKEVLLMMKIILFNAFSWGRREGNSVRLPLYATG